jgi:hypothetical protein
MSYRRKLIEVALPLEAISEASVYEKFIRFVNRWLLLGRSYLHPSLTIPAST